MTQRGLPTSLSAAAGARVATLEREAYAERLWARDPGLWSADPAHQSVARQRLGWLDLDATIRPRNPELTAFARDVVADGFTHAVLLGMGGSSLAPEVFQLVFGSAPGYPAFSVLDSTSPAAVRDVLEARDPSRTLFIVSSKSGGTIEVVSLEARCFEWVRAARASEAGVSFVAITDPGTSLERLAGERGYRRVFLNPPDVGGRYSALSLFGLVPAAVMGVDLGALLDHAEAERRRSQPSASAAATPGLVLGAALGELALRGLDKVTLVLGHDIGALGSWIEQLLAESTGKQGRGLVPVVDEPLAGPDAYGADRVFVALSIDPLPGHTLRTLELLERAGHPVLQQRVPCKAALGSEFLRWEIATTVAASILGVDPFDEPNVAEAKQATRAALDRAVEDGRVAGREAVATRGAVRAEAPAAVAEALRSRVGAPEDPVAWAAALATLAGAGDYFAVQAFFQRTRERDARLERVRLAARAACKAATTLGYGPRFLHSTGQLHKGGPATGVFLQLTADETPDVPIPGAPYGLATLIAAQAAGDFEALKRRDRRVLRIHLGADTEGALEALAEAMEARV